MTVPWNSAMEFWTYNLFDKDRFQDLVNLEGIDLSIDLTSENEIREITDLVVDRMTMLEGGDFTMGTKPDVISYNLLRIAAALSDRGQSWFFQKESDLFKKRVQSIDDVKILVSYINHVVFNGNISVDFVTKKEMKNYYHHDVKERGKKHLKLSWKPFSSLIKDRKYTVHDGWIYAHATEMKSSVIGTFKEALVADISQLRKVLLDTDMATIMQPCADLVDGMVETVALPDNTTMGEILARAPLCMRILDRELAAGVDIGHKSSLILAFFLKAYKGRDELVEYFFSRSPRNKQYASSTDFLADQRFLDYIFKQMYGEKGGGTSYKPHKCTTIYNEGACPFASMMEKPSETRDRMERVLKAHDGDVLDRLNDDKKGMLINVMSKLVQSGNRARACGIEFEARFETEKIVHDRRGKRRYVSHPVKAYFEEAVKIEHPDGDDRENDEEAR